MVNNFLCLTRSYAHSHTPIEKQTDLQQIVALIKGRIVLFLFSHLFYCVNNVLAIEQLKQLKEKEKKKSKICRNEEEF